MKFRVAFFWAALSAACGHATLERSTVRGAHESGVTPSEVPVRGATVDVEFESSGDTAEAQGELIAVDSGFVYVTPSGQGPEHMQVIPKSAIRSVTVEIYPSRSGALGGWTALGCASTLSHGYYLVFTGPAWLATGIASAVGETGSSHAQAGPGKLNQLFEYARFPQGLPRRPIAPVPAPELAPPLVPLVKPPASGNDAGEPMAADAGARRAPPTW